MPVLGDFPLKPRPFVSTSSFCPCLTLPPSASPIMHHSDSASLAFGQLGFSVSQQSLSDVLPSRHISRTPHHIHYNPHAGLSSLLSDGGSRQEPSLKCSEEVIFRVVAICLDRFRWRDRNTTTGRHESPRRPLPHTSRPRVCRGKLPHPLGAIWKCFGPSPVG